MTNKQYHVQGDGMIRYVEIPVRGASHPALVDAEDADKVAGHPWKVFHCGSREYAIYHIGRTEVRMHRVVMDAKKGETVDHINCNGLDNRRSVNLRMVTALQNAANRRVKRNATSQYKGISQRKRGGRWVAHTTINGKSTHIGVFATEEEAARAYDAAVRAIYGEYGRYNFPLDGEQAARDRSD